MSLNAYNIPLFFAKRKAWQKKWDKCHLPKFFAYQIKEKAITVVIALFYFLLYVIKYWAVKKFAQCDVKTVAEFFDGYHPRVLTFFIQNAVNR